MSKSADKEIGRAGAGAVLEAELFNGPFLSEQGTVLGGSILPVLRDSREDCISTKAVASNGQDVQKKHIQFCMYMQQQHKP